MKWITITIVIAALLPFPIWATYFFCKLVWNTAVGVYQKPPSIAEWIFIAVLTSFLTWASGAAHLIDKALKR